MKVGGRVLRRGRKIDPKRKPRVDRKADLRGVAPGEIWKLGSKAKLEGRQAAKAAG